MGQFETEDEACTFIAALLLADPENRVAHELEGVRGIPDQAITKPGMQRTR